MGPPPPAALAPGLCDHVCHVYDGADDIMHAGVPYLAEGLALGQRTVVIAPTRERGLAHRLAGAASAHAADAAPAGSPGSPVAAVAAPAVDVLDYAQVFGAGPVDVDLTLRSMDAVLTRALDGGATGLRAVGLLTHVATEPLLRRSFAAWEHAVGEWQSSRPIASACCFDRGVLGDKAVQELACLHPRSVVSGPPVPFRLCFRAGRLALEGEIDSFSAPLLARAVEHVRTVPGERLVIDARDLLFVNHRALAALVDGLAGRSGGVTLLGGPTLVTRLADRLGIHDDALDVLPWPW